MKQFFIALATLALVHSVVSFAAYRFLTKTTVQSSPGTPPIETTTPEQRARGELSFVGGDMKVVRKAVPAPVIFYVCAGYAGLAIAALYPLYFRLRYGH